MHGLVQRGAAGGVHAGRRDARIAAGLLEGGGVGGRGSRQPRHEVHARQGMAGSFGHVERGGDRARRQGLAGIGLQAKLARHGAGDALAVALGQRLREHGGGVHIGSHPGHAAAAGGDAHAKDLQLFARDLDVYILRAFRRFGEGVQGDEWR
ncbi:hypothetical protein D3C72_1667090 [compost metagenome]